MSKNPFAKIPNFLEKVAGESKMRNRKTYYRVLFGTDNVARSTSQIPSDIENGHWIKDWTPVSFVLPKEQWNDYQSNNKAWQLCSERLRELLDTLKTPSDVIAWLDASITDPLTGETAAYHLLYFPEPLSLDILDHKRSIFNPKNVRSPVVKPCFNRETLQEHNVFTYMGGYTPWFVSSDIRNAAINAELTGLELSRTCQ